MISHDNIINTDLSADQDLIDALFDTLIATPFLYVSANPRLQKVISSYDFLISTQNLDTSLSVRFDIDFLLKYEPSQENTLKDKIKKRLLAKYKTDDEDAVMTTLQRKINDASNATMFECDIDTEAKTITYTLDQFPILLSQSNEQNDEILKTIYYLNAQDNVDLKLTRLIGNFDEYADIFNSKIDIIIH